MAVRWLTWWMFLGACGTPATDGSQDTVQPSSEDGFIFKGPFAGGGVVQVTPLDDALEPVGDPVDFAVAADDGSYTISLDHTGPIRIVATGRALDEATGELSDEPITLRSYSVISDDAAIQLNVLTELTYDRITALVAGGATSLEAQRQARSELAAVLPLDRDIIGEADAARLNPYGRSGIQNYLFAISALFATAARSDPGGLNGLLADLGADLADDGAWDPARADVFTTAQLLVNPDLAERALAFTVSAVDPGRELPNLNNAIDSDLDGVKNDLDNCRYLGNTGQEDSIGLGFGDACDERLLSISIGPGWGCGVRARDNSVVCWDVNAGTLGGAPPTPEGWPSTSPVPWGIPDFDLTGSSAVAVSDGLLCVINSDYDAQCNVDGASVPVGYPGPFVRLVAGPDVICGLDDNGMVTCFDKNNYFVAQDDGPFADVKLLGDGNILGLYTDGTLGWIVGQIPPTNPPTLPTGTFSAIAASEAGVGCAIDTTGVITCFGDGPLTTGAPEGNFTQIAVGTGIACASHDGGELTCWHDTAICPTWPSTGPGVLTAITAGGCQVCGLDERGVGSCWPRKWDAEHPY